MAAASSAAHYRIKGDLAFSLTSALGLLLAVSGAVYAASAIASDKIFEITTGLSREIPSISQHGSSYPPRHSQHTR